MVGKSGASLQGRAPVEVLSHRSLPGAKVQATTAGKFTQGITLLRPVPLNKGPQSGFSPTLFSPLIHPYSVAPMNLGSLDPLHGETRGRRNCYLLGDFCILDPNKDSLD